MVLHSQYFQSQYLFSLFVIVCKFAIYAFPIIYADIVVIFLIDISFWGAVLIKMWCLFLFECETLIRRRRLFEAQRLLEESRYLTFQITYSKLFHSFSRAFSLWVKHTSNTFFRKCWIFWMFLNVFLNFS